MPSSTPLIWQDVPGAPPAGSRLAQLTDIPDGGALLVRLAEGPQGFSCILLRSAGQVFAYVNRCAHFGVPLAEKVEHLGVKSHISFRCSVHYARYRWQDGYCESGDCEGESLLPIPVTVINDAVVIAG